ncbi:MAG: hypothetical protein Q9196_003545 [Gyalolechia fulgens]
MDIVLEEPEMQAGALKTQPKSQLSRLSAAGKPNEFVPASAAPLSAMATSDETTGGCRPAEALSRKRTADPETIQKVEAIIHQIVQSLQRRDENISIALKIRQSSDISSRSNGRSSNSHYQLSFPGNTPQEAWRFSTEGLTEAVCRRTSSMLTFSPAVVLRILELIHEALVEDVVISKRNIYYKDPELFNSQTTVDRYVDILAYTFGIQRASLNVVSLPSSNDRWAHTYVDVKTATAKGLVSGSFIVTYHDGSNSSSDGSSDATLINNVDDIRSIDISNVRWILVVEKESTFRTLDSGKIHESLSIGKGIILTAKGYPDLSTRAFLRLLSISTYPPPPIYALVDFDPDGIAIMSTFKHGSLTLSHENANLKARTIRWLGIKSKDIFLHGAISGSNDEERKGLLRLNTRDRKKAVGMLGKDLCEEDGVEQEWRRELQVMLMLNTKAEMEILSERRGAVKGWIEESVKNSAAMV